MSAQPDLRGLAERIVVAMECMEYSPPDDRLDSVLAILGSHTAALAGPEDGARSAWRCRICGAPATCFGSYGGQESSFACDDCCAHGITDGKCVRIVRPVAAARPSGEQEG